MADEILKNKNILFKIFENFKCFKEIIIYRSVCKEWNRVLKSADFWLQKSNNHYLLDFCIDSECDTFIDDEYDHDFPVDHVTNYILMGFILKMNDVKKLWSEKQSHIHIYKNFVGICVSDLVYIPSNSFSNPKCIHENRCTPGGVHNNTLREVKVEYNCPSFIIEILIEHLMRLFRANSLQVGGSPIFFNADIYESWY